MKVNCTSANPAAPPREPHQNWNMPSDAPVPNARGGTTALTLVSRFEYRECCLSSPPYAATILRRRPGPLFLDKAREEVAPNKHIDLPTALASTSSNDADA